MAFQRTSLSPLSTYILCIVRIKINVDYFPSRLTLSCPNMFCLANLLLFPSSFLLSRSFINPLASSFLTVRGMLEPSAVSPTILRGCTCMHLQVTHHCKRTRTHLTHIYSIFTTLHSFSWRGYMRLWIYTRACRIIFDPSLP